MHEKRVLQEQIWSFHGNLKVDFLSRQLTSSAEDKCDVSGYGVVKAFRTSHQLCMFIEKQIHKLLKKKAWLI